MTQILYKLLCVWLLADFPSKEKMNSSSGAKPWYPEWEVLDELPLAENSRKRFVYTLKKLKNKKQLFGFGGLWE